MLHQPHFAHLVCNFQVAKVHTDVVGAAIFVVLLGGLAVDDELEGLAAGITLRIEHWDIKHHFARAGSVAWHLGKGDRVVPVCNDHTGGQTGGVDTIAGPQVQAIGRVIGAVALVVHAHGFDVGC